MTTFTFTNKTVVITGAGGGLGKVIAEAFFNAGANVVLVDIQRALLEQTQRELGIKDDSGTNDRILTKEADVTNEASVQELVSSASQKYSRLDILVNNAGIMDRFDPVGQVDKSLWDRVMAVNVTGPMLMSKAFINALDGREGVILNVSSVGGVKGSAAGAAYTTSKHALLGLTRNTAAFYGKQGLRCNAVLPGVMRGTHIGDHLADGMNMDAFNKTYLLGAAMDPENCELDKMAKLVLYMCSDDALVLNGSCVTADRGWTAY